MSSIDKRVVEMEFNNRQFEGGVKNTLDSLSQLKKGLQLDGATRGLSDVDAAAKRVDLSRIGDGVDKMASKFNAMTVVATAALTKLTFMAVDAGVKFAKSIAIDPIIDGLREYETNLNSIQTILSNTQWEGKNLEDVNKALKELNDYADLTIYNFAEMARNIGTFTAAGVELDTSVAAIKGIANVAAISGSNAQQASTAMYQLSQALSTGTVRLMDWNSVSTAGMGGKVLQDAILDTARVHGVAVDELIEKHGSFRDSLRENWFTAEILTDTLAKFTGDLTDQELLDMGYSAEKVKEIQKMAESAVDAATKVKTFTQLIDTVKEAVGTGWADTFQLLFGDFEEAKELWTGLNNVIGEWVSATADARNKVLTDWKELGGRTVLIDAIKKAFEALMSVVKPFKEAFRDFFPAVTGERLYEITVSIREFFESIKMGAEDAAKLNRVFDGLFALFGIVFEIAKEMISAVAEVFGVMLQDADGALEFFASVGDHLVELYDVIKNGEGVADFIGSIIGVLTVPININRSVINFIRELFEKFWDGAAIVEGVSTALDTFQGRLDGVRGVGGKFLDFLNRIADKIIEVGAIIGDRLVRIGDTIAAAFTATNFDQVLDVINTSLLAAIVILIKKFFSGEAFEINVGEGMFDGVKEALGSVTDTMKAMQAQIKADVIIKIAGALALLTASLVALSMLDSAELTRAGAALAIGFAGLSIALVKLSVAVGFIGTAKLPIIASSMVGIATALVLFAGAMKIMASIDGGDVAQSLVTLGGSLFIIGRAMKLMPRNMIGQAAALTILGVALNAIAIALKIMGSMDWEEIGKGLAALAGSLILIGGAMHLMPRDMVLQASALAILGLALNEIAVAMKIFGSMDWEEIGKGLLTIAGALVIIGGAMHLMPPDMVFKAAAITILSAALVVLSGAMKVIATMSWEDIAQALVAIGGALLVFAGGLTLMSGTMAGALALVVATGALAVLTPILITLGSLSWQTIVTGLLSIAGIFAVLGVAGLVLAPLTPIIIGLSGALLMIGGAAALIGAGLFLAGAGAAAFATAFGVVVAVGAAGVDVLSDILMSFIATIPAALVAFGRGIVELAVVLAEGADEFYQLFVTMLLTILDSIIEVSPKIGEAFLAIMTTILNVIVEAAPKIYRAGIELLLGFLEAIRDNLTEVMTVATEIIVKFLEGIADNLPDIIQSGVDLILAFVNGMADSIRENSAAMAEAGVNLAGAIIEGMITGLHAGIRSVVAEAKNLARTAIEEVKKTLGVASPSKVFQEIGEWTAEGFAEGLVGGRDDVIEAWDVTVEMLKNAMESSGKDVDSLREKLEKLRAEEEQDQEAIKETIAALQQAKVEYVATKGALGQMTDTMAGQKAELEKLGKAHDMYTEKLDNANQALENAIKTRDDYKRSIQEQYKDLPDITQETGLEDYINELEYANADIAKFADVLQELRDMGLSDALYEEFLAEGPDILPFLEELLEGGKESVKVVNDLSRKLEQQANRLGQRVSKELYQAGVDAAQGLKKGLESKLAEVEAMAKKIGDIVAKALKAQLKVKSPSRVMEEIGRFVAEGLVIGMEKSIPIVDEAASTVGSSAIDAMKKSISEMSAVVSADVDMTPTITPVLDLSEFKKDASQISSTLADQQMDLDAAYSKAKNASHSYQANEAARNVTTTADDISSPAAIVYNQYNTSPKALSSAEIYRQTKNQLSVTKGALTPNAT